MSQSYGVLRVVRVRPPAASGTNVQEKYAAGWLPEEKLVHVLTRRETTVGRSLSNDVVLMDLSVSREHARLVLDASGWRIVNLTAHNIVRVNGQPVPSCASHPLEPQDIIVLGGTMLQFLAPTTSALPPEEVTEEEVRDIYAGQQTEQLQRLSEPRESLAGVGEPGGGAQTLPPAVPPTLIPPVPEDLSTEASDPLLTAVNWDEAEAEAEGLLGAGVTMQFALPQRMGKRTRWLFAGVGLAILAVCAIITVVINSIVGITALSQNGASSLLAAATIPLIPAAAIFLLVNFIDRFEREPWFLRLAAFLWGMVIAIPTALFIEQWIDNAIFNLLAPGTSDVVRSALKGLNAGVTEETIKGLGLLLLFVILRDEFDNVTDGIVYSAMIGAGFALVENFSYFATGYKNELVFMFIYRIVLGWLGHPTFTACFGAPLGYTRHTRTRWLQIVAPLLGYLLAVALHSFFDFVDFQASAAVASDPRNGNVAVLSSVAVIADYIPPFLAQMTLLYFLIKSLAHEAAIIREFLAPEVSSGVVSVDEYALLQSSFQRTKQERKVLFKEGFKQWLRIKALYQTEIGLAFRKWHVSMGDKRKTGYLRQPEDAYRERIRRLRNEIRLSSAKGR